MRFDASRLAVLAGLSGERSGLLREGVHPEGDENLDIMDCNFHYIILYFIPKLWIDSCLGN